MALYGIDVSHWQGTIDFSKWLEGDDHNDFMLMKATQGVSFVDSEFYRNACQCMERSVLAGSYHYVVGDMPALDQARHYIAEHKKAFGDYPAVMALDVEDSTLTSLHWMAVQEMVEIMVGEIVGSCNTRPFIYVSKAFMKSDMFTELGKICPGWIAHWNAPNAPRRVDLNTSMWQTSSTGVASGIKGRVDTDTFFGTADAWRKIAVPPDLNGAV